uniref:Uncharacterized protein n=1 Tax=Amphimedon queenslandica TaxID=400682 RepID=A0A1X7UU96_AMPQE
MCLKVVYLYFIIFYKDLMMRDCLILIVTLIELLFTTYFCHGYKENWIHFAKLIVIPGSEVKVILVVTSYGFRVWPF